MGAMGSPVNSPVSVVMGNKEDFYVLYSQDKVGSNILEYYVFDPSIPSCLLYTSTNCLLSYAKYGMLNSS